MFHRYNYKFDQPGAMFDRISKTLGKRSILSPLLALVICGLLLLVLQHLSQAVDYRSIMRQLRHLTAGEWAAALGATTLSYIALIGRDAVEIGRAHV